MHEFVVKKISLERLNAMEAGRGKESGNILRS